jgi:hypothetical protein
MSKSTIKREWDDASQTINAAYPDGVSVAYCAATLPEAIRQDCLLHGLEQKLFDSIAGETKKGTTLDEIRAQVMTVYTNLVNGDWKGKRGSSEGPSLLLLTEAVARLFAGGDLEAAKKHIEAISVEERKSLAEATEIKIAINSIKNERLAAAKKTEPTALENLKKLFAQPVQGPEPAPEARAQGEAPKKNGKGK